MAQLGGTYDTRDIVGEREDLENVIFNVAAKDVPFQKMIGSKSVKNSFHEWQTDTLRAASTSNAFVDGDQFSYADPTPTVRVGNHAQIMRESVSISGRLDVADLAGRAKEMAYQTVKKGTELMLDREAILMNNQASVLGTSSTPGKLGGFPAWLTTNARRGTGGADGGWVATTKLVAAATDATTGDLRTFTETLLADMLQDVYDNASGAPKYLFMCSKHKRLFSGFTGISELRTAAKTSGQQTIVAGADMYLSDWGELTVVVDRFQRKREVFAVNPEYVSRGVYRGLKTITPAKTADSDQRVLLCDETLVVSNEAAHGVLADLL